MHRQSGRNQTGGNREGLTMESPWQAKTVGYVEEPDHVA